MDRFLRPVLAASIVMVTGCVGVDEAQTPEGRVGKARQSQIDPGHRDYIIYRFIDNDEALLAEVLVTATSHGGFAANTEYWRIPNLTDLQSATKLHMVADDDPQEWPVGALSFTWDFHVPQGEWSGSSTPSGTKFIGTDANSNTAVFDPSALTKSGATWGGTLTWWYSDDASWVSTGGAGSFTLDAGTVPSGTWYTIVGTPSTS